MKKNSIVKIVNNNEVPPKEKHIRRAILCSTIEAGCSSLFSIVQTLPLTCQNICCFKVFYILHRIMSEGHQNSLKDCYTRLGFIQELAESYKFSREVYGQLSHAYGKLLFQKINFHAANPSIPSSYMDYSPIDLPRDVNTVFSLGVSMLDLMEQNLMFAEMITNTLQPGRDNSAMVATQCRIVPLVPIIKETKPLFDLIVSLLVSLHKIVPAEALKGHRDRFTSQFQRMKKFFQEASVMMFISSLVYIPQLPPTPPDFLLYAPATLPVQPVQRRVEPKPEPAPRVAPQPNPRDTQLEKLMAEINELRERLTLMASQFMEKEARYQAEIERLSTELDVQRRLATGLAKENSDLKEKIDGMNKSQTLSSDNRKVAEEKLAKMVEHYTKLRNEHTNLLRQHTELQANFSDAVKEKQDALLMTAALKSSSGEQNKELMLQLEAANMSVRALTAEKLLLEKSIMDKSEEYQQQNNSLIAQLQEAHVLSSTLTADKLAMEKTLTEQLTQQQRQVKELVTQLEAATTLVSTLTADKEAMEKGNSAKLDEYQLQIASEQLKVQQLQQLQDVVIQEKQVLKLKIEESTLELEQQKKNAEEQIYLERVHLEKGILMSAVDGAQALLQDILINLDNTDWCLGTSCSGQYLRSQLVTLPGWVDAFNASLGNFHTTHEGLHKTLNQLNSAVNCISKSLFLGQCASQDILFELADEIRAQVRTAAASSIGYMSASKSENPDMASVDDIKNKMLENFHQLKLSVEKLILHDNLQPDPDSLLNTEIANTSQIVEEAAGKILELMEFSKLKYTGVQLEVNEKILGSCNDLMEAIQNLIIKSKDLQMEIVEGRGGVETSKEFYKKNHKWTEGLISAAKAVGFGASMVVNAADKCIQKTGKMEELIVASSEVSVGVAQLMAASNTKASPASKRLTAIKVASRDVNGKTAAVIASARSASSALSDAAGLPPDYGKLSVTQSKRLEMESQVKIIELESSLMREQEKLGKLRALFYHNAENETTAN